MALMLLTVFVQCQRPNGYKPSLPAFASPSIPPPPSISMPVWSLASPIGQDTSMNIVTFAIPVSVAPPKIWAVSLYSNTKTRTAFLQSKVGVLQLLTPSMKHVVPLLGKRSGYEEGYSKRVACANLGQEWIQCDDTPKGSSCFPMGRECRIDLLPGCASYLQLKVLSTHGAGDHDVALCEVLASGMWNEHYKTIILAEEGPNFLDSKNVLYSGQLRDEGII